MKNRRNSEVRIGIIGCGYWGPNLVRNFNEIDGAKMASCCDIRRERIHFIKNRYPSIEITTDYKDVLEDTEIDAVAIATPVHTHYKLAKAALQSGKHVLIEKPMTASTRDASKLIEIAQRENKILMVDHTFIYTGAVRKIKEITESGEIGKIYYFDSVRVNLGLFQHDVNVIWDLAPHDISIMDYVIGVKPLRVRAVGNSHIDNKVENIAYIHIDFENDLSAHLHINWLAPVKVRRIIIGGSNKMIVYDDNEPSEKVKIYDKGVSMIENKESIYQTLIQYRTGDMYAPKLDHTEALQSECRHFVNCIKNNTNPLTGGKSGAKVVKILEAADMSIRKGGRSISL